LHLLRTEQRSLDEAEVAVDLGQTPAGILFLSFSDSDLGLVAAAAQRRPGGALSLRLAYLRLLKPPYSVDLYVEKAASQARFVLVRLLGGLDYWRYGVEEFLRAARARNFALAIVPGDAMEDPRLDAAPPVPPPYPCRIPAWWDRTHRGASRFHREPRGHATRVAGTRGPGRDRSGRP